MSKEEKQGLVNLLLLAASSHFEGFLIELIRGRMSWLLLVLKGPPVFPNKKVIKSKVIVSTEPKPIVSSGGVDSVSEDHNFSEEQGIVFKLLDQWIASLEGNAFQKLKEQTEVVTGNSFKQILGGKLAEEIDLLFELRNLIAHGRDAYVVIDMTVIPGPDYDRSPLRTAVNVLRNRQFLPNESTKKLMAIETINLIFSLEVAEFLYESSRQAQLKFLELNMFKEGPFFWPPQSLPKFPTAKAP